MSSFQIKKILVPVDFSKTSLYALDYAIDLAKKSNAQITLLHVAEGFESNAMSGFYVPPTFELDYNQNIVDQNNKHLTDLSAKIKKKGAANVNILTSVGKVSKEIIAISKQEKASVIIMGTHGVSGVKEFFMGSNAFKVIKESICPVLTVQRKGASPAFKKILLPFTAKPHSREKVNYAIDMALLYGATLHVLGVDNIFTKTGKRKIELEAAQIKEIALAKGALCKTKVISDAYVADVILKHAMKMDVDLITIMANLDKANFLEYFSGPVSQQIVNHSSIPVLSIHPKFNTDTVDLRFY